MRLELTIIGQDGDRDIAVCAPAHATVGQLLADLGATRGLWSGERSLPAHTRLDSGDLRSGARLSVCGPTTERDTRALLGLHQVAGPGAGRSVALSRGTTLVLGRAPGCDVVLDDQDASRRHALIEVHTATATVRDLDSTNGTTVDQRDVGPSAVPLPPGAYLRIGCCAFTVGAAVEAPAVVRLDAPSGARHVQRAPQAHRTLPSVEVAFPAAPRAGRPHGVQWIAALVPAVVGVAIAWVTGSPQFLLFMLLSPVMMLSTSLGDRVHWRRSRRRAAASYHLELAAARRAVDEALHNEAAARRSAFADPVTVLRTAELPGRRLWERRRADPDLLRVRVGTADLPSVAMRRDGSVTTPAGTLSAVPFDIDLRAGALAVAGPREVTTGLVRWLIGQLATAHTPDDLALVLFLTTTSASSWRWARWLPHLDGRVAVTDREGAELVAWLGTEIERRRATSRPNSTWRGAWLVVVVDLVADRALDPTVAAMLSGANDIGVTGVFVADDPRELPGACEWEMVVDGEVGNRARIARSSGSGKQTVVPDLVSPSWAEAVARALAPFVARESAGIVGEPAEASLARTLALDLEHLTADVRRRWSLDDGGAYVTLGHTVDGPLTVDLEADGPHLLVAGTTGSGKSELLQTLVASLATAHPPERLTVLMIDYKGGAAFAECADLPHSAGLVTDLDAYLTARALQSLTSELRRREQLFAAADVTDLAGYRSRAPHITVPRLVIVVDEFAALADELPDFVHGLVSIAQRGRSLGVHLVLATQRPSAVVSAEIRANTSLRIALRVTDAADSMDVIGDAGAALIDPRTPGRAYLRTGSGLTSFHTAWSGARSGDDAGMRLEPLDPWRRRCPASTDAGNATAPTDLARLVRATREAAGTHRSPAPWLPALPAAIPRTELGRASSAALIRFGLRDEPHAQRQSPVEVDLDSGTSLLVAGAARTGRTQTLATLAVAAASQLETSDLHIHVVDAVGDLTSQLCELPHLASVLGPHDSALVSRLLRRLTTSTSARPARTRTLLLIDGWPNILADLADVDALDCAELLATALRLGSSSRLTTALTGDRTSLAARFAGQFAQRLLLRLDDRADYTMCGIPLKQIPDTLPVGRAVCANDGAIVQLAHCGRTPGPGAVRIEASAVAAGSSRRASDDPFAICVRPLPKSVGLRELVPEPGRLTLGVGGDAAEVLTVELPTPGTHLLVAGHPRSGRSTLLLSLLTQAVANATPVVVAATSRSPLAAEARAHSVPVIGPNDQNLPACPNDLSLLLVDDCETFVDSPAGDAVLDWLRADAPISAVVAGRSDDLASAYRGIGAYVRRGRSGVLLRPAPMDGELLGIRLPRRAASGPPGRGIIVGEPSWGAPFDEAAPLPIQIATP